MEFDLNDDQVALLMDLLKRTINDVKFYRQEAMVLGKDGNYVGLGYAGVAMYQTECRLLEVQSTIENQSGHKWVHNDVTQRMEPRYKAREEMGEQYEI